MYRYFGVVEVVLKGCKSVVFGVVRGCIYSKMWRIFIIESKN